MSNKLGALLEKIRIEKNLSLREAAALTGLGHSYIRDLELGINRKTGKKVVPSINSLRKIANAYDLNIYELLNIAGLIEKDEYTSTSAHPNVIPVLETLSNHKIIDYIFYPLQNNQLPDFALIMQGDSMSGASIDDGDIVFFQKCHYPEYNGQIVAAASKDGDFIRRITWTSQHPNYTLIPENKNYRTIHIPFSEINIYGVYSGHFKPEKT